MFSGLTRSLAIVRPEGVDTFPLPAEGLVRIGRAEGNDLRVDDPSLSRRHAVLHVGEELRLQDLGGTNPTRIRRRGRNDPTRTEKLLEVENETVIVEPGDRILLGSVQMLVRRAEFEGESAPIVNDPTMLALFTEAERVAASPINVLLLGETGVGKEVLAEFIHAHSARSAKRFVAINCSALSETLLEAELFGSERGAYTGATQARPGLLETADGGTLLLDEVGELSPAAQAKLLRVLEDQRVLRVGGREAKQLDVRFVAATNRNLEPDGRAGTFRSDLYFRLAGASLRVPPLRERRKDILALSRAFLARACSALAVDPLALGDDVIRALESYSWPGNVRELKNAMERAAALCTGPTVELAHLPRQLTQPTATESPVVWAPPVQVDRVQRLKGELHEAERQRILDALARSAGNQTRAAAMLGISRRTLLSRLEAYDLPRPRKG